MYLSLESLSKAQNSNFCKKKHLIFNALFNKNAAQHRTICKKRLHYYRTLNHFRQVRYRTICHFYRTYILPLIFGAAIYKVIG